MLHAINRVKSLMIQALRFFVIGVVALLTFDVLWGVFSRFILNNQSSWTEELARVLLIWVSLLGASLAFAEKGHLGVDCVVNALDPGARKLMKIIVQCIIFLFAAVVLIYGGMDLMLTTLRLEQSMPALGIPKGYLYLAAPVSGLFTAIFALENLAELFQQTDANENRSGSPDEPWMRSD